MVLDFLSQVIRSRLETLDRQGCQPKRVAARLALVRSRRSLILARKFTMTSVITFFVVHSGNINDAVILSAMVAYSLGMRF